MNGRTKIGFLVVLLALKTSLPAFTQPVPIGDLQRAVDNFSSALAMSLPLNASLGLNWSSAYIGRFFPSIPPSFGVGVSFGVTSMDTSAIRGLAAPLGLGGIPGGDRFPFPAYTAEARIGGFFLPFDVGFKFGHLPPVGNPLPFGNRIDINYLLVGGDIRYALLDRAFLPRISVGLGFNYLRGGIGGRVGQRSFDFDAGRAVEFGGADVDLNWRTFSFDAKAQISQSFIIATPFLGVGASFARSRTGFEARSNITVDGGPLTPADVSALREFGIDASGVGMSSNVDRNDFNTRVFGGIGINLTLFRLDFVGIYSFRDGNYGASIGFRFQT
ncbi:MAG: hypothetical protein FWC64_09970 [Treponema sp.]|nr:hypothetical protein [Treponema sp.]